MISKDVLSEYIEYKEGMLYCKKKTVTKVLLAKELVGKDQKMAIDKLDFKEKFIMNIALFGF